MVGWCEVFGQGVTLSGPTAVVDRSGRLKLFARGLDDGIWENDFIGDSFRGWFETSGRRRLDPMKRWRLWCIRVF